MLHVVKQIERRFPHRSGRVAPILLTLSALLLLIGLALTSLPARAADDPVAVATRLLDQLDAGEFAAAESSFTAEMAAAVPAEKLALIWQALPTQVGPLQGRGEPSTSQVNGMSMVSIPLQFAKAKLLAKVVVDADDRIAGLLIQPAPAAAPAAPAEDAPFRETDIEVGTGETALPGTLAMPRTASAEHPVPGVVLIHGSGSQDRNETIGPNRPFLDIARGLAAHGIAVLRYDKRNFARPQDFADDNYDIDEVVTDDAIMAVATMRGVKGIDPANVFVLGHSLGAMLAPRIALESGKVAGLVLVAAPARPILDILIEQNHRLAAMDGDTSDDEKAAIAKLVNQVEQVRMHETVPPADSPMGLPAKYWRSVEAVKPIADAKSADLPMFLAQGGRDIQVVEADWQRWKAAFGEDPEVTMKFYPALNHLGIAGEGPGTLVEYHQPGHVDPALIGDIAQWIHAHD